MILTTSSCCSFDYQTTQISCVKTVSWFATGQREVPRSIQKGKNKAASEWNSHWNYIRDLYMFCLQQLCRAYRKLLTLAWSDNYISKLLFIISHAVSIKKKFQLRSSMLKILPAKEHSVIRAVFLSSYQAWRDLNNPCKSQNIKESLICLILQKRE